MGDGGARCVGFLGLLAWWLWLMARVILQSAALILALLRETRRPFAKRVVEVVRFGRGKNATREQRASSPGGDSSEL
jgi:hypothetical protein